MEDLIRFKRKQLKGETIETKTEFKISQKISKSLNRASRRRIEDDDPIFQAYQSAKENFSKLNRIQNELLWESTRLQESIFLHKSQITELSACIKEAKHVGVVNLSPLRRQNDELREDVDQIKMEEANSRSSLLRQTKRCNQQLKEERTAVEYTEASLRNVQAVMKQLDIIEMVVSRQLTK